MGRLRAASPWLTAFLLTLVLAVFQRLTGPTHPLRGRLDVDGRETAYMLPRSHGGDGGMVVRLPPLGRMTGILLWRRFPTDELWLELPMAVTPQGLSAEVPHQPPAGKVEYRIVLEGGATKVVVPADRSVVARFKGAVPVEVLIPHILAMFAGMLVASRALLAALGPGPRSVRAPVLVAAGLMVIGGFVLGPMVQRHAFGAYWTGWPLGEDLTDTKTMVAVLAWLPAVVLALRRRSNRLAVALGWAVMMGVFLIPHSSRGSQLNWETHSTTQRAEPSAPPT